RNLRHAKSSNPANGRNYDRRQDLLLLAKSGRQDSNLRLRGPKPRALARLSYAPRGFILQCGGREDKGSGVSPRSAARREYTFSRDAQRSADGRPAKRLIGQPHSVKDTLKH